VDGKVTTVYACQCTDGRLFVVNSKGKPFFAPPPPPGSALAPSEVTFDPQGYAASLREYGDMCKGLDVNLLRLPGTNPTDCLLPIKVGMTCSVGCKQTMEAIGFDCYQVALATEPAADPSRIKSTP
jgi:hypothetical protein